MATAATAASDIPGGDSKRPPPTRVTSVVMHAPHEVQVSTKPLAVTPSADMVLVRTLYTAVSPGTELLAYTGGMPCDVAADATIATQQEAFSYPAMVGYTAVGEVVSRAGHSDGVEDGKGDGNASTDGLPQLVFAFREHQSAFFAAPHELIRVPRGISARQATLLPGVETAVSLLADAHALPGEVVLVVGQGLVGLLVSETLARTSPYTNVVATDVAQCRLLRTRLVAPRAILVPAGDAKALRDALPRGADVVIEVSGSAAGLDAALRCVRDDGRIVLGSWFGASEVRVGGLGGSFHRSHCTVVASQVSKLPVRLQGRWTKQRRFDLVWRLIGDGVGSWLCEDTENGPLAGDTGLGAAHSAPVDEQPSGVLVLDPTKAATEAYECLAKRGDVIRVLFDWRGLSQDGDGEGPPKT